MSKIKWTILLVVLMICTVVFIVGTNYIYQDHRDIVTETPKYILKAQDLVAAFQDNEELATQKYLNETISVEGLVSAVDTTTLTMNSSIFFALSESEKNITQAVLDHVIKIKGRCIGYDSILEEIKFDQAVRNNE